MNEEQNEQALITEDETKIDSKEKLGAFVLKYALLNYKKIIFLVLVAAVLAVSVSGFTCSYKSISVSKSAIINK